MEHPLFFEAGTYSLFGIHHEPDGGGRGSAFVFCHPLGEEKLWTHRVFVSFARQLAAAGHHVLRFDYMGNGDSDGEFDACSLETVAADIGAAIRTVLSRSGSPRVTLLGLRAGAAAAALVADVEPAVERLILWAPVVDGARYMQDLLRINLTTQMAAYKEVTHDREMLVEMLRQGQTVNVDGYEMSYPLFAQMSDVKLAAGPRPFAGRTLVVQVERQTTKPVLEVQQLASAYPAGTFVMVQEEPFWKEIARFYDTAPNLFAATTGWLEPAAPVG